MSTIIGICAPICSLLISVVVLVFGRTDKGQEDAAWRGKMDAKLDNIMASVTGLRTDVERIEARLNAHAERLAKVEASASQAHKRLDTLGRMINDE